MSLIHFQKCPEGITTATTTVPASGHYAFHTEEPGSAGHLHAQANRHGIIETLHFKNIITIRQTHSDFIHTFQNDSDPVTFITKEGDGLITSQKDILLGVLTADCVPVLFSHPSGVVGIAHAGWKGAAAGIHLKMLNQITTLYQLSPGDIQVGIAPHIRPCCYEVGNDFEKHFPGFLKVKDKSRYTLSLEDFIIDGLIRNRILKKNIEIQNDCTCCSENPSYFSYRKGNITQRNLTVIGIKGS